MGKKIVILEVEEKGSCPDNTTHYKPIDGVVRENIWLLPDRIIDSDRLGYGIPKDGDIIFNHWVSGLWQQVDCQLAGGRYSESLILDPEPKPEQTEWDQWVESCPYFTRDISMSEWMVKQWREELMGWAKASAAKIRR